MESCIYHGRVRHRRHSPVEHRFTYPIFMMYLDLDEAHGIFKKSPLLSDSSAWAPASFLRRDHDGDPDLDLKMHVNSLLEAKTGRPSRGPVRLLTHLRYFGHYFSPVNFFFCFGSDGGDLDSVIAEVSNTPWGQTHSYVLSEADNLNPGVRKKLYAFGKDFHVSPFMGMEMDYRWRLAPPGRQLVMHMENLRGGKSFFDATMTLRRREMTTSSLLLTLAAQPLMTLKIMGAIYWQAFRLWAKKTPFHSHPEEDKRMFEGFRT